MEQELTAEELRVLACLVEKSFTTPDQYPLTTNSLTNACNQKTSRDPVVDYSSQLVDRTMLSLRDGGWARSVRGVGNRAFKHKHVMDERLDVTEAEQAVLAVLALRGPQSAGELCTRTERYAVFPDDRDEAFAAVEDVLAGLAGREAPLVRNVGRASGQSQDRWIQLLDGGVGAGGPVPGSVRQAEEPVTGLSAVNPPPKPETPGAPAFSSSDGEPTVSSPTVDARASTDPLDAVRELTERIAALEQRVADLEDLM
ncbi:MAG: YceH family protein [Acidimicrobiia bacterium]|nr:YceH family protein [Acidimicrobiia bacterium]